MTVAAALLVGAVSYKVFGEWRAQRLLAIQVGLSQQQVRAVAGEPDQEQPANRSFGCANPAAAIVWTYRIDDSRGIELVFDRHGKLICNVDYFISI